MRSLTMIMFILGSLWLQVAPVTATPLGTPLPDVLRLRIYERLTGTGAYPAATSGAETLRMPQQVRRLYDGRVYAPVWSNEAGLSPHVEALLAVLRNAADEGLQPADYHLETLEVAVRAIRSRPEEAGAASPARLAWLDVVLSDAFLTYATHLRLGQANRPTDLHAWFADHPEDDVVGILRAALVSGRVAEMLHDLPPAHAAYTRLRQALARYRRLAALGGWPVLADGPTLRPGDRGVDVLMLRWRLQVTGDLADDTTAVPERFDSQLEYAVRTFQKRYGLRVDGLVGPKTRQALNVPVQARMQQIIVNMDRWRQLPQELGSRYILVNIPAFTLSVVEADEVIMRMRVVVGKPSWPTPTFSDTMQYLVLNPYWNVPRSIATEEILPKVQADPAYLAKRNIQVLSGWGDDARTIDASSINWNTVRPQTFSYRFRQAPGPWNALGQIKFMFPNQFSVYLHDTASESLFARPQRAFSHGCVRVARPLELAAYVLQGHPDWTRQRLQETLRRGIRNYVHLPEPLPIHLVYQTAWVEADGAVHFRHDLYGHDRLEQVTALR